MLNNNSGEVVLELFESLMGQVQSPAISKRASDLRCKILSKLYLHVIRELAIVGNETFFCGDSIEFKDDEYSFEINIGIHHWRTLELVPSLPPDNDLPKESNGY